MDVRTFRASTMQEALAMVRQELGPAAAVLHTREVGNSGLLRWIPGFRKIEVTASAEVNVPSRLPGKTSALPPAAKEARPPAHSQMQAPAQGFDEQLRDLHAMVEDLCRHSKSGGSDVCPELFHLYTDLIDAEISEELSRELVEKVRAEAPVESLRDPALAKARVARLIEDEIRVSGPIHVTPGKRHLVALVGPTGVGKTTTIAKLAANFRLREKRRVGLITVDTYRIAAVEQLRTYADIIDLPMRVVSTPREMRQAVEGMEDLDLVLLDTAGRSPRDEVKIQELKSFLTEAQADEVHLVLSAVAGAKTLERTAARFADVGTTSLILTKLDEATGLGNLIPLFRSSQLPLSYLTDGQNVPDDIAPAERNGVVRRMLGTDEDR